MKHSLVVFIALYVCSTACRTPQSTQPVPETSDVSEEETAHAHRSPESSLERAKASAEPDPPAAPTCKAVDEPDPIPQKTSTEFDAFRKKAKSIGERSAEEFGRETWAIVPAPEAHDGSKRESEAERKQIAERCGDWLGEPVPQPKDDHQTRGECIVEFQLGGAAAAIEYISECSSDGCTSRHYVWRRDESAPVRVDQPADSVNVASGGEYVYYSAEGTVPTQYVTYRSKPDGSDECMVTDACFSPRLSPDGSYLLCRNLEGEVMKVSMDGGEPETAAPSALPEGYTVYVRPQWGVFPQPVEFVDEVEIRYEVTHVHRASTKPRTMKLTYRLE